MFEGRYTIWGLEHSLFTRKLQAMLNYQRLPYDFRLKSQEHTERVEVRVGTHFIPALETPEGWFIHDTTPIGLMLDAKYPDRPIVPATPVQRIACHVLEDWADEWFGRYAIHTRWCYPDTVAAVGRSFVAGMLGKRLEDPLTDEEATQIEGIVNTARDQFGLRACKNRGCGPDQAAAIRADFDRLLDFVDAHFQSHSFLLGQRASLGDFTFAGVFRAHFKHDPEPRSWVDARAPSLIAVMDRIFDSKSGSETWMADDALPETLSPFFEHMVEGFHVFLRASRVALAADEKWCEVDLGDGPIPMRALKYCEISRCHIREEIERLTPTERAAVEKALGPVGVVDVYLLPPSAGAISS